MKTTTEATRYAACAPKTRASRQRKAELLQGGHGYIFADGSVAVYEPGASVHAAPVALADVTKARAFLAARGIHLTA